LASGKSILKGVKVRKCKSCHDYCIEEEFLNLYDESVGCWGCGVKEGLNNFVKVDIEELKNIMRG